MRYRQKGFRHPNKTEDAAVTGWIRSLPGQPAARVVADGDPGRVTARRLNRARYNDTVRDLRGVHVKPADEFPVDDSGYGFDYNGDVLTLSPAADGEIYFHRPPAFRDHCVRRNPAAERLPQAGLHGSDRRGVACHSLSGRTRA